MNEVNTLSKDPKYIENLSVKYFNNTKPKHLQHLAFTTPKGNECECYINRNHTSLLGSMVITKVNGVATEQFIHGMPKLHYYNDYLDEINGYVDVNLTEKFCYIEMVEKVDGTNICLYKLKDHAGKVIEVVPKTRNMPVLSKEFQELYENARNINIENYLWVHDEVHSILLELSGYNNPHSIGYDYPCKLHLLCFYDNEYNLSNNFGEIYQTGVSKPPIIAYVNLLKEGWDSNIFPESLLNQKHLPHMESNISLNSSNLEDLLNQIGNELEIINTKSRIENCIEGGILNLNLNGRLVLMKLKPPSIKESHTLGNGIPSYSIKKEIMKYFDEYGQLTAKENVENNIKDVILYLQDQLKEEYSYEYVVNEKTTRNIKTLLEKHVQNKALKKELISIGETIIKNNPSMNIGDLMRTFSTQHTDLKHQASEMFNVFQTLLQE